VLITVGFVTSMIYDVHEGGEAARGMLPLSKRLLPEIIRPSFVEQLNSRNEKVEALEGAQKRLADELRRSRAEQRELKGKVENEASSRRESERKAAALEKAVSVADETVRGLKVENEELRVSLKKETEGRTAAEGKLVELEKTKAAAKEGFSTINENLTLAAENLKKVVTERDGLKAELDALKSSAPAVKGTPDPGPEVRALAQQVKEKEEQRTALAAEVARLQATLERVREALAAVSTVPERPGK
jgi:chromosome segregation ATPase